MQPNKAQNIALKYPLLNISWLMTDTGDMLNEQDEYKNESSTSKEKGLKPHNEDTNYKPRPYIDAFYGALGVPYSFTLAIRANECKQISIPFISNYDFSIRARSDSMINRKKTDRSICNKDLIACRIWTNRSYIQWRQVYALATSQEVVIKQIQKSEKKGYIKSVSVNDKDRCTPYEMPVEKIYDCALVISVTYTTKR